MRIYLSNRPSYLDLLASADLFTQQHQAGILQEVDKVGQVKQVKEKVNEEASRNLI